MIVYGSYGLEVENLEIPSLCKEVLEPLPAIVGEEKVNKFVSVNTYASVAAPKSTRTVWRAIHSC